jgi:hypothetical protein
LETGRDLTSELARGHITAPNKRQILTGGLVGEAQVREARVRVQVRVQGAFVASQSAAQASEAVVRLL